MWDWPTYASSALVRNCTGWSLDLKSQRWLETCSQLQQKARAGTLRWLAQLVGADVTDDFPTQKFNCKVIRLVPVPHQRRRSIEWHNRLRWFQCVFWGRPAWNLGNYSNRTKSSVSVRDPLVCLARCTRCVKVTSPLWRQHFRAAA